MVEKNKILKEIDVIVNDYLICDKCNATILTENFEVFRAEFKIVAGEAYYEGGFGETKSIDLCQNCAEQAL